MPKYVDVCRLFHCGEQMTVCKEALSLDTGDKVLAKAVGAQLIRQLPMQCSRGRIVRVGKKGTALVWRLPD